MNGKKCFLFSQNNFLLMVTYFNLGYLPPKAPLLWGPIPRSLVPWSPVPRASTWLQPTLMWRTDIGLTLCNSFPSGRICLLIYVCRINNDMIHLALGLFPGVSQTPWRKRLYHSGFRRLASRLHFNVRRKLQMKCRARHSFITARRHASALLTVAVCL